MEFFISEKPLESLELKKDLKNPSAGGYVCFEGWVRNHNEGKEVKILEYEAYPAMAQKEAMKILKEAKDKFLVLDLKCVHRVGTLQIGEMAVWVAVCSAHRKEAFDACEYIIDQIKVRLPIWKKEHYTDGDSGWVNCQECARHIH